MESLPSSQTLEEAASPQSPEESQPPTQRAVPAPRKKRKTVSKELQRMIVYLHDQEPMLSLKEIARVVDLSYSCVKATMKKI